MDNTHKIRMCTHYFVHYGCAYENAVCGVNDYNFRSVVTPDKEIKFKGQNITQSQISQTAAVNFVPRFMICTKLLRF